MRVRLDIPLSYEEVAEAIGAVNVAKRSDVISYVCTDTREAKRGDLFFSLRGKRGLGEDFLSDEERASLIIVSEMPREGVLTVQDSAYALLLLGVYYKSRLKRLKYMVTISGSVGKTTSKEFLKVLARSYYSTHANEGNFNNEIGVALTLLSAGRDTELIICEVGMNKMGEISQISRAISPDIALITNIGTAHIGNLGSRENIARAKLEILDGMKDSGVLIIPSDEPLLSEYGNLCFSTKNRDADIFLSRDKICEGRREMAEISFSPDGEHNLLCLGGAVAVARRLNIDYASLSRSISLIKEEHTRQKIFPLGDFYILDDCYNSSLESVKSALSLLSSLSYPYKSALIGDILELGEYSEEIHEELGRLAKKANIDNLYLFGRYADVIRRGAEDAGFDKRRIFVNSNPLAPMLTVECILENTRKNEIILFKASRGVRLEEISRLLKEEKERNSYDG